MGVNWLEHFGLLTQEDSAMFSDVPLLSLVSVVLIISDIADTTLFHFWPVPVHQWKSPQDKMTFRSQLIWEVLVKEIKSETMKSV